MWPPRRHHPCPDPEINIILGKLEIIVERMMTVQDDVNAAVAAVQAVVTDLTSAVANIQAEIAALNVPVDTSQLDAAVASLQQSQAAVDALETPAPPAPSA